MFRNILSCTLFLLLGCTTNPTQPVIIAVAANAQFAIRDIVENFELESGIECEMVVSSSGKLTAQIRQGAPFHLFISADMGYPLSLFEDSLCRSEPVIYAYGKIVWWTADPQLDLLTIEQSVEKLEHIAIANPELAPYGEAALSYLNKRKLYQSVASKLVYGESIGQVNQFVISGAAQAGITALSIVKAPQMKHQGQWKEIESEDYKPIAQGMVTIKQNSMQREVDHFVKYMTSQTAMNVLDQFGYQTVK